MNIKIKIVIVLSLLLSILSVLYITHKNTTVQEQTQESTNLKTIDIYYLPTCTYCHKAMDFLDGEEMSTMMGGTVKVNKIDISSLSGSKLFKQNLASRDIKAKGVPTIIIGDEVMVGFDDKDFTREECRKKIKKFIDSEK